MANQCTVNEAAFLQPCQENTVCDGCRKTAEKYVKAESVVAELLVRPKCTKRLRKFQIVDVRPIRARRKLNF